MSAAVGEAEIAFLDWLESWYRDLQPVPLESLIRESGGPDQVAVMVVDLLVGFCSEGPLASPRVAALGSKTAAFLSALREPGVRSIVLAEDSHPPYSPEFAAFPPHCIRGTREAETIPELTALSFFPETAAVRKGSLNVGLEAPLEAWIAEHAGIRAWIVLGDCTDLCVYQAAMHLRLRANTRGEQVTVCVPAGLVDTYDLPLQTARELEALPHPGDLMHRLFLYHMALNGIRVVSALQP